jgi:hypothetical protein
MIQYCMTSKTTFKKYGSTSPQLLTYSTGTRCIRMTLQTQERTYLCMCTETPNKNIPEMESFEMQVGCKIFSGRTFTATFFLEENLHSKLHLRLPRKSVPTAMFSKDFKIDRLYGTRTDGYSQRVARCAVIVSWLHGVFATDSEPYGVDVSFPMHHMILKEFHSGNDDTRLQQESTVVHPRPLGMEPERRYQQFMHGCVNHYNKKSERCWINEREHICSKMRQPEAVYNYSKFWVCQNANSYRAHGCTDRILKAESRSKTSRTTGTGEYIHEQLVGTHVHSERGRYGSARWRTPFA